jgi:hypothetical protein
LAAEPFTQVLPVQQPPLHGWFASQPVPHWWNCWKQAL